MLDGEDRGRTAYGLRRTPPPSFKVSPSPRETARTVTTLSTRTAAGSPRRTRCASRILTSATFIGLAAGTPVDPMIATCPSVRGSQCRSFVSTRVFGRNILHIAEYGALPAYLMAASSTAIVSPGAIFRLNCPFASIRATAWPSLTRSRISTVRSPFVVIPRASMSSLT